MGANNTILVTGSRGYIGENLVEALRQKLWEVKEYDILDGKDKDILDKSTLYKEMRGCIAVYNCAAISGVVACEKNPKHSYNVNVVGAKNVVGVAKNLNVKPILFSSQAVYGESEYGLQKSWMEKHNYKDAVILRPSNVYGGKGFYEKKKTVLVNFSRNRVLEVYGGTQRRDFIHIDKIIENCINALTLPNGIYNVKSGEQISIRQLALLTSVLRGGVPIRWLREEDRYKEEEME